MAAAEPCNWLMRRDPARTGPEKLLSLYVERPHKQGDTGTEVRHKLGPPIEHSRPR